MLLAVTVGACSNQAPVTCAAGDITANTWSLVSYGTPGRLMSLVAGTQITLNFLSDGARVAGSAGCNAYFGASQIDTKTCGLKFDSISATERGCAQVIMDQEQKYLALLQTAQRYSLTADGLRIVCGKEELNFVPYVETP